MAAEEEEGAPRVKTPDFGPMQAAKKSKGSTPYKPMPTPKMPPLVLPPPMAPPAKMQGMPTVPPGPQSAAPSKPMPKTQPLVLPAPPLPVPHKTRPPSRSRSPLPSPRTRGSVLTTGGAKMSGTIQYWCRFHAEGRCDRGVFCTYAHSMADFGLRRPNADQVTAICRAILSTGFCPKMAAGRCPWFHPEGTEWHVQPGDRDPDFPAPPA